MVTQKMCSLCKKGKDMKKDFYKHGDRYRSECKKCTIKRNVKYQQKHRSWILRFETAEARRAFHREYYAKNKEKFALYRATFHKKHPNYAKMYKKRCLKRNKALNKETV